MGHQRSHGKRWVKLKGSPGILLPEDLQDQNGRFCIWEDFLLFLVCFASLVGNTVSLSLSFKFHTFLKSLLWPSRLWWPLRLESMTNGVSRTSKWESGCLKWPWTPPNLSVYTVFLRSGAGVLRVRLHHQTRDVRIQLCGWQMQLRFQKALS